MSLLRVMFSFSQRPVIRGFHFLLLYTGISVQCQDSNGSIGGSRDVNSTYETDPRATLGRIVSAGKKLNGIVVVILNNDTAPAAYIIMTCIYVTGS